MAAVKLELEAQQHGGERLVCGGGGSELVTFDAVPSDVALGDEMVVWYRVSANYRPKSGDWIGLFACASESHDEDDCVTSGVYSYVAFQWAPKYPNVDRSIPRRRVIFNSDQIKVCIGRVAYYRLILTGRGPCLF